jgi:PAS domain-containing protein
LEAKFRRKDGQIAIGLMSARVFRVGQENIILSIIRDITERKMAEERLRETEKKYRELADRGASAIQSQTRSFRSRHHGSDHARHDR